MKKILSFALVTLGLVSCQIDENKAKESMHAITTVAESVKGTAEAAEGAATVVTALEGLAAAADIVGILGVFLSFIPWGPSNQQIMDELKKIEQQIANLSGDMSYYFGKVIDAELQDTCFVKMAAYELKIKESWSKLHDVYQTKTDDPHRKTLETIFMDSCAPDQCGNAALGLLNTVDKDPSFLKCDLLSILSEGNPNAGYMTGVRDQVVSKAAYITTLVSMGIVVQAAYVSL
jgi:hypothetical protein